MSYLALLTAGLAGMLLFWILALWLWRVDPGGSTTPDASASQTHASQLPMQFRRIQSGTVALFGKRGGESAPEDRARRNCMMVDTVESTPASPRVSRVRNDDDDEINRRATGIYLAQPDSPRPRDARANQELETQPYKRARHHMP